MVKKQRAQIVAALTFLVALLLLLLSTAKAETYIIVYDQEDDIVTSKVEFIGAKHYNETHAIVEDPSFVAIVYKGVKLHHLEGLKDNATYAVKVALGRLALEIPKGLYYKVIYYLAGLVFEGMSEGRPVDLGLLPYGLVEVVVRGSQELREVVNWQGGPIRIKEEIRIEPKAFFLLLLSLIPAIAPIAFTAYYIYRRHKLLASVRASPMPRLSLLNPRPNSSNPQPKSINKVVAKPLNTRVRKEEEDEVMKILRIASKSPMSIADLVERDVEWLKKELKKAEKHSCQQIDVRLALARLRERMGLYMKEKAKKLRRALAYLFHEMMSDKIEIVIYEHYPKPRNKPCKGMKRFRGLLRSLASILRFLLSSARREVRGPPRFLRAHKS
jgi:hypothetical protein